MSCEPVNSVARQKEPRINRAAIGICVLLAAMVWAVFGQTCRFDFVDYDDNAYVYENPTVIKGPTIHGFSWAFIHPQVDHWVPLTTISHMMDCGIYGLTARGHHLTNVLLHGAAAILLFLGLQSMTGALWRSAFVAAVFAIHPLHVESVAWVSERKDVLSAVFFMLTLAAYVHYTRKPQSLPRYLAALFLFAAGLMSKDMLVTLPLVLLLLDYWPLDRRAGPRRLLTEKAPFFAFTAVACVVQMLVIQSGASMQKLPLTTRISNGLMAYVIYLGQMIYPAGLAVSYPRPGPQPALKVMLAVALLAGISACVVRWRKRFPFLLTGWFWYLGMLVPPVVGFVRVGHAQSDRYTYLPQTGLCIAVAWLCAEFCALVPWRRTVAGAAGAMAIALLMWRAWIQTSYWQDSQTLWNHALAVTTDNAIAENGLGAALFKAGRVDESMGWYLHALEIRPDYAEAHYNLGLALQKKGETDRAIAHYKAALEIDPNSANAHCNLAVALQQKGLLDDAMAHDRSALEIDPDYADAHNNLGYIYQLKGDAAGAITEYEKALEIMPGLLETRLNLGIAFEQDGNMRDAMAQFQKAVEINPGSAQAHNNLGLALLQSGGVDEAIVHFRKALEIEPGYADARNNLNLALGQGRKSP